jgi:hypothetical protein
MELAVLAFPAEAILGLLLPGGDVLDLGAEVLTGIHDEHGPASIHVLVARIFVAVDLQDRHFADVHCTL